MATNPVEPRNGAANASTHLFPAPMPAVARILSRYDRQKLEGFIAVAIDLLDVIGGDADAEEDDPAESAGDEQDTAYTEWHDRGRHKLAAGNHEGRFGHEDDEEDDPDTSVEDDRLGFDPETDFCLAGDDRIVAGPVTRGPGFHDGDIGCDDDAEPKHLPAIMDEFAQGTA